MRDAVVVGHLHLGDGPYLHETLQSIDPMIFMTPLLRQSAEESVERRWEDLIPRRSQQRDGDHDALEGHALPGPTGFVSLTCIFNSRASRLPGARVRSHRWTGELAHRVTQRLLELFHGLTGPAVLGSSSTQPRSGPGSAVVVRQKGIGGRGRARPELR